MPGASRWIRLPLPIILCALGAAVTAPPLPGQDSTAVSGGEWRAGGSIGVPGFSTAALIPFFSVGLHLTRMPAGPVGIDLAVGTSPYALNLGALVLGARGALTVPVRHESLVILPGAGVSYLDMATQRAEAFMGGHIGAAIITDGGLRKGLTLHWFGNERRPVWLFEVGYQPLRDR